MHLTGKVVIKIYLCSLSLGRRNRYITNILTENKSTSWKVTSMLKRRIISPFPVPQNILAESTLDSVIGTGVKETCKDKRILKRRKWLVWSQKLTATCRLMKNIGLPALARSSGETDARLGHLVYVIRRASSDLIRCKGCGPSPSNISGACPVLRFTVGRTVWPLDILWYCKDECKEVTNGWNVSEKKKKYFFGG